MTTQESSNGKTHPAADNREAALQENSCTDENPGRRHEKVAVTGATGLIGSNLAAELVKAGYRDIILIIRNSSKIASVERTFELHGLSLTDAPVRFVETELSDTGSLAAALEGIGTVFNCAGTIMTGELTEQQLIENNAGIAGSVVDACLKSGVGKIIHTSSIVILDPGGDHITPITEKCIKEVTAEDSAYARSKYAADLEITRGRREGLATVTVLPAVVLGEGDWSLEGSSALIPVISRGLPVYTCGVMAYADVRDVARAMITLHDRPEADGETFIIAGANLSYKELIMMGAEDAGRRRPFIRVGKAILLPGYGIIRALTALRIMKDRSIRRSNIDSILYGNHYDGSKIEKFCNFAYTPPTDTVRRVVGNYLSEKKSADAETNDQKTR